MAETFAEILHSWENKAVNVKLQLRDIPTEMLYNGSLVRGFEPKHELDDWTVLVRAGTSLVGALNLNLHRYGRRDVASGSSDESVPSLVASGGPLTLTMTIVPDDPG